MYKVILSVALAIAFYMLPTIAAANPTSTSNRVEQTQVKKKPVKKKKVTKKKIQEPEVHVVRTTYTPVTYDDTTAHGFFALERMRNERNEITRGITPTNLSAEEKRRLVSKNCSLFSCPQVTKASKVVAEAKKWEGATARSHRKELANLMKEGNNQQPVDPVRIPWCAGFVNAILARSGYETTESLQARSFLNWGAKTKDPKEGDIVVLTRGKSKYAGHVGFFQGYEWYGSELYVKVLGGNQSKSVNVAYFPARKVLGYRTAQG